jgi:hypothetical protein
MGFASYSKAFSPAIFCKSQMGFASDNLYGSNPKSVYVLCKNAYAIWYVPRVSFFEARPPFRVEYAIAKLIVVHKLGFVELMHQWNDP